MAIARTVSSATSRDDAPERPRSRPEPEPPTPRRSDVGRVLRGSLAILTTQPITWSASLVATVFIPRYLTDAELGEMALATTVAALVALVMTLGIPTALVRSLSAHPERSRIDATAALALQLAPASVAAAIVVVAWQFLPSPLARTNILVLALGVMLAAMPQGVLTSVLVARQQNARFAWVSALMTSLPPVVSVGVLILGGDLVAVLVAQLAVTGPLTLAGWRLARIDLDRAGLSMTAIFRLLRAGLPLLGWAIANRVRIDLQVLYLGALAGQQAVGLWSAANRVAVMPIFIPTLIITPLLPSLSRAVADPTAFTATVRQAVNVVLLLTMPAAAGIAVLSSQIPGVLGWGPEYAAVGPTMSVVALMIPLIGVSMVLGTGVLAMGRERAWLVVAVAAIAAHAAASFSLVPLFATWQGDASLGAAAAQVVSELVMTVGALILLPRRTLDGSSLLFAGRILAATACLALAAGALRAVWLPAAVVGGGLAYGVAVLAVRAITIDELRRGIALGRAAVGRRLTRP